jgi:hypothetical protein
MVKKVGLAVALVALLAGGAIYALTSPSSPATAPAAASELSVPAQGTQLGPVCADKCGGTCDGDCYCGKCGGSQCQGTCDGDCYCGKCGGSQCQGQTPGNGCKGHGSGGGCGGHGPRDGCPLK